MDVAWSWWQIPGLERRALVARLPKPPTRAQQRALSDSLTCRLFADAGIDVAVDDFGRTIYGKPQLRHHALHHSVANTGSLNIGVLAPGPIGIDVEALDRTIRVAPELLRQRLFATADEALACLQHWTLIQAWTAKEAVLKAGGMGLSGGLANVMIAPGLTAAWLHGSSYGLSLWVQEGFSVAVADGVSSRRA